MSEYLSRNVGLGIQGVAIRSGAAKKQEEDREAYMDIMNRSLPPSIKQSVKPRQEMPSGFRMAQEPSRAGVGVPDVVRPTGPRLTNPLSKEDIYAKMGIDGSKELEIDWDQADMYGNANTRVELADRMFEVLQKEKKRLEYAQQLLVNRKNTALDHSSAPVQPPHQR